MKQSPYFANKKNISPKPKTSTVAVAKNNVIAKKNPYLQQTNNNNDGSDGDSTDDDNNIENNKMRDDLLLKLRPFQREAYDFATQGKITPRQWNDSKQDDFHYDPALLGKGRILLAGE
jgi:hypothetical protein